MSELNTLTKGSLQKMIEEELALFDEGIFSKMMAKAKGAFSKKGKGKDTASGGDGDASGGDAAASGGDAAASGGDGDASGQGEAGGEKAQADTETPIELFTGKAALMQRMHSSIKGQMGKEEGAKIDKEKLQTVLKGIMKDLSAQLRANGLKVQESKNIYYPLILQEDFEAEAKAEFARAYEKDGPAERMKTGYTHLGQKVGLVPQMAILKKGAKLPDPGKNAKAEKVSAACKQDQECAKQYKQLRRKNAELSKQFQRGGSEAEKGVRGGGRVKPEKGVLNVSQALGGKLKVTGLDQKIITKLIVKMARPYFQKLFKQRGIEGIKIKEAMKTQAPLLVEALARNLLKENKSVKIRIKRK